MPSTEVGQKSMNAAEVLYIVLLAACHLPLAAGSEYPMTKPVGQMLFAANPDVRSDKLPKGKDSSPGTAAFGYVTRLFLPHRVR